MIAHDGLYRQLIEAYSIARLNKISLTLLKLYKEEQFGILKKIAERIEDYVKIDIDPRGKGFSKLMMLYHPDRSSLHLQAIERLYSQNKGDELKGYAHILELEKIEDLADTLESYEDIDYSPVYEWDVDAAGFRVFNDKEPDIPNEKISPCISFYDAIKMRQYGQTDIEFPANYLEDIEKFELSSCRIDELDGVQFCIHAKALDLSDNQIFDLDELAGLKHLKKLNLADNQIGYIDALVGLNNLKTLDLSNNRINDISPLFELDNLKYVCLSGNPVEADQIDELREYGVEVEF